MEDNKLNEAVSKLLDGESQAAANESKTYEDEIYYYLTNRTKLNKVSFYEQTYRANVEHFVPFIAKSTDPHFTTETIAYLLGKSCEMAILNVLRPEYKRVWVNPDEITSHISTNLPSHLHDAVLEMMDGCENAVDKYLEENSSADIKAIMLDIQFMAETIANKHKLFDIQVEGYTNKDLIFPFEAYTFVNNVVLKEFEEQGYKVEAYADNNVAPINVVLSKDDKRYAILESITIEPKQARFEGYLRDQLIELSPKENADPYVMGVMICTDDPNLKGKDFIVKNGRYMLKRTDLIPAGYKK